MQTLIVPLSRADPTSYRLGCSVAAEQVSHQGPVTAFQSLLVKGVDRTPANPAFLCETEDALPLEDLDMLIDNPVVDVQSIGRLDRRRPLRVQRQVPDDLRSQGVDLEHGYRRPGILGGGTGRRVAAGHRPILSHHSLG